MTEKRTFILAHDTARQNALEAVRNAPHGFAVVIREPTRSLEQNAALWPVLRAFSKQKQWPVNGEMVWLEEREWKDLLTAAASRESPRIAPGINGGMVLLGVSTSEMEKKPFSDLLEFSYATAVEFDINPDMKP